MRSNLLIVLMLVAMPVLGVAQQQPASLLVTNRGGNVAYGLQNSVGGTALGAIFNPEAANTWSLGYATDMTSSGTSVFSWTTTGVSVNGTSSFTGDLSVTGDSSVTGTFDVTTSSSVVSVTDKLGVTVSTAATSTQSLCLVGAVDALPSSGYSKNCLAVLTSDNALYISTETPVGDQSWIKVGAQ